LDPYFISFKKLGKNNNIYLKYNAWVVPLFP
jgi:hypothetical protein